MSESSAVTEAALVGDADVAQSSDPSDGTSPSAVDLLERTADALVDNALASLFQRPSTSSGSSSARRGPTEQRPIADEDDPSSMQMVALPLPIATTTTRPSSSSIPLRPATAALLTSALPIDPLFPSAPSAQLLVALAAAEGAETQVASQGCELLFSASPPPAAARRIPPVLLGDADGFPMHGLASVPRSVEGIVQERLRWRSAHRPHTRSARVCTSLPSLRCPAPPLTFLYELPIAVQGKQSRCASGARRAQARRAVVGAGAAHARAVGSCQSEAAERRKWKDGGRCGHQERPQTTAAGGLRCPLHCCALIK